MGILNPRLIATAAAVFLSAFPTWAHPGHGASCAGTGFAQATMGDERLLIALAVAAALWAVAHWARRDAPSATKA